jgi:DNA-binding SARP family transcriptional activator
MIRATERPAPADGALDIRVLGEIAALHNGEHVALPPSRKTRTLLAYLKHLLRRRSRSA